MKKHLHSYILQDSHYPKDVPAAIHNGFLSAERAFFNLSEFKNNRHSEVSGTCAVIALAVDDIVYVGHVGDSRAVVSINNGLQHLELTRDHKPDCPIESHRVTQVGATIRPLQFEEESYGIGPNRLWPGALTVN
jgi:serine/threonine protein phosphatase PrpC